MAFVDSLAVMLLALGSSASLMAIYFIMAALQKKNIQNLVVPSLIFGMFDTVSGFIMAFAWPLPGAYNILFGDPMLFLGLILTSAAIMLYKNMDLRILSVPGFLFGIYVLIEGIGIVTIKGLESGFDQVIATSLYTFAGLSALFSPLMYANPKTHDGKYAYYFLAALLILTALVALIIGYSAIYGHLASPP
ncbi:MAG: DUF981 family protein [Candidatus Marsarchaeota archaeon]|nr:DUF981 family protein [Candidatus Marsarchaeota archaeon]